MWRPGRYLRDVADTYSSDLALFKKLGLEPFEDADTNERSLGRVAVDDDGSYVDVFVACYPAQFWRFVIHRADSKETLEMRTGSGTLSAYWPAVEPFAQGMADITLLADPPPTPSPFAAVPDGPRTRLSPLV